MERNPQTFVACHQALASATYTATQTPSTGFDCRGWEEMLVIVNVGAFTSTASMTIAIQESSASDGTGDAFATIATFTAIAAAANNTIVLGRVRLPQGNRYIRAVSTYAGSGNAVLGIVFVKMWPRDTAQAADTFDVNSAR